MSYLLALASTHARACLIAGLAGGVLFPKTAALMVPWLPHMVAVLLTVTALRVGHRAALGAMRDLWLGLACVVALQLVLPLIFFGLLFALDLHTTSAALAILLTAAAPAITGSVNLALLLRLDAGRMMQLLVLGTAVFPLTILPLLMLLPQLGSTIDVVQAALWLLIVILLSAAAGFGLRARLFPDPNPAQNTRVKGIAGLLAISAGNRNIAIFLVALPPDVMAPLMIFVGCWQLPMYLTPILLPRLYAWALGDG